MRYRPALVSLLVSFALAMLLHDATFAQSQRQLTPAQLGLLEDNIRREQVRLRAEPQNSALRGELAHHLDALANYHEGRGDNMSAARYFEAAAMVMQELAGGGGRAQANLFAQRALKNRQLRLEHLRRIQRLGAVIVASDWSKSAHLDGKTALAYTSAVNDKLRDTWSEAHKKGALKAAGTLPHFISAVFKLNASGRVISAKIVASCGNKAIDDLAEISIKSIRDVPPLLPAMGAGAVFRAEFTK